MGCNIIDGKHIAEKILCKIKSRVLVLKKKGITPSLAVVLVGDDKPSQTYARRKAEAADRVGINFTLHKLPASIKKQRLISFLKRAQGDKKLNGLIVQLPLPQPLYTTEVLNAIKPELDVDCLTDVNLGKLVMRTNLIVPPTPGAVMTILDELKIDLKGKNITVVGTGPLVGKPLTIMLMNAGASVTTCNSETKNNKNKSRRADIIVSGVGKRNLVRGDMVKKGAIVIDAGVNFYKGKMFGDVNFTEVSKKASYITPTPGGIGPITVARLLWNVVNIMPIDY